MKPDRVERKAIAVASVGRPAAVESLAALILQRLASRERPTLTIVTDVESRRPIPAQHEG